MEQSNLVKEARAFALEAHKGLIRPNKAQEPYSVHLEEVAGLVEQSGGSDEEVAAAWLHDSVEDTDTTIEMIRERFGAPVATIVDGLTDKPDLSGMPTFERKRVQAERVRDKSKSVKRAKVADQTSNLRSVAVDPPVDWTEQKCKDYIAGAKLIADECKGVSPFLDAEFQKAYERASQAHP